MKKSEESLRELWYTIKQTNSHIMRVTEGEIREKGREFSWRNRGPQILNMRKKMNLQNQKFKGFQLR